MANPKSHFCVDAKLFMNETNGLTKGSSNAMVMMAVEDAVVAEDLVVAEDPPNMRNRSSTFRYGVLAYLADRSAMVR